VAQKFQALLESILYHISATNPTQHDLHQPYEPQTTINYHHLNISRDDGMDEQEIRWLFAKLMEDCGSEALQAA
jgi:hypothetical protein